MMVRKYTSHKRNAHGQGAPNARSRYPTFENAYAEKFAAEFGRFRLPLISGTAAAFDACGDWGIGIARIQVSPFAEWN